MLFKGAIQCLYCEKYVRDKRIFGTLHICLTPDEIKLKQEIEGSLRQTALFSEKMRSIQEKRNINYSKLIH